MKKKVIQSVLAMFLVFGLLNSPVFAATAQQPVMSVISVDLPVYSAFDQLSDPGNHTHLADLTYNTQVIVLSEKDYAAQIQTTDGTVTGWVHKAYLSNKVTDQTWLVKQGRNLRADPSTANPPIGFISDNSMVYVLDYNSSAKFYKIQTSDGKVGWIKGTYQRDDGTEYGGGRNVIPYEFGKKDTATTNISIYTPLNTKANVTADQINKYIQYKTNGVKTLMTGLGSTYLQAQTVTRVNAVYLLAHSGLESKWGTSAIASNKYNFYGIHATDLQPMDSAYDYSTPTNGIIAGAEFISDTYVNRDQSNTADYPFAQPTLDNMRFNDNLHQYSTDEAWASKIANLIKEFNTFTYTKGWKQIAGQWYFNNGDGTYKTGWLNVGGKWYYFKSGGVMQTGWLYTGGQWYYLNSSGAMQTGWLYTGGKWYYLNTSGTMQKGWKLIGSKWYFFYSDGHMAANTKIGKYRLGSNGAMI
ncbi:glucosaminidase domain-containing protein [Bacillus sp. BRMEA1]|uniref:glucosaminidase domain-containing protein n=1 Tax=Neobacillus endophyticus TaxID=2738405 RepID=UPI00156594ED|nr:glucosaminidase domain-containing protein [Neobacillus endophyticus]NRD76704.1 glucosaminidase domain-containing protein [Neobacillus endophyticus]